MKKFILRLTGTLVSCENSAVPDNNSGGNENSQTQQNVQNNESADILAYIVIPSGSEYVEMKSSIENGSVLCRLYANDEVIFNHSEQKWANISANGFTGYVKLINISFSAVETESVTQAQAQEQETAETQAVPVQDNGSQSYRIGYAKQGQIYDAYAPPATPDPEEVCNKEIISYLNNGGCNIAVIDNMIIAHGFDPELNDEINVGNLVWYIGIAISRGLTLQKQIDIYGYAIYDLESKRYYISVNPPKSMAEVEAFNKKYYND